MRYQKRALDPVLLHEREMHKLQANLLMQNRALKLAKRKEDIALAQSLRLQPLPPKEQHERRREVMAATLGSSAVQRGTRRPRTPMAVLHEACLERGRYLGSRVLAYEEAAKMLAVRAVPILRGGQESVEHIVGAEFIARFLRHVSINLTIPVMHAEPIAIALGALFVALDTDTGEKHQVSVAGLQCGITVLFNLAPHDGAAALFSACDYAEAGKLARRDIEWLCTKALAAGRALCVGKGLSKPGEWDVVETAAHFTEALWAEVCIPGDPYIFRGHFQSGFAGMMRGDAHRQRERAKNGLTKQPLTDFRIRDAAERAMAGTIAHTHDAGGGKLNWKSARLAAKVVAAAGGGAPLRGGGGFAHKVEPRNAMSMSVDVDRGAGAPSNLVAQLRARQLRESAAQKLPERATAREAHQVAHGLLRSGPAVAEHYIDDLARSLDAAHADPRDVGIVQRVTAGLEARDLAGELRDHPARSHPRRPSPPGSGEYGALPMSSNRRRPDATGSPHVGTATARVGMLPPSRWHCEGVSAGSPAERAGLRAGDVFEQLGYIVMANLERDLQLSLRQGRPNEVGLFMQLAAMGQVYGGEELELVVRRRDSFRHPWRRLHLRIVPSTNAQMQRGHERFGFKVGVADGALAQEAMMAAQARAAPGRVTGHSGQRGLRNQVAALNLMHDPVRSESSRWRNDGGVEW